MVTRASVSVGVSSEALRMADATVYIPMSGFVSSFNVSVAAALAFYEARRAREERWGYHGDLTENDKHILTAVMLLRHQVKDLGSLLSAAEHLAADCASDHHNCAEHSILTLQTTLVAKVLHQHP